MKRKIKRAIAWVIVVTGIGFWGAMAFIAVLLIYCRMAGPLDLVWKFW